MKATLELINQMQADGVIAHYAIGGALAAATYSEPATTLEIEVFVILPFDANGPSVALKALEDYLTGKGCRKNGDHFDLAGWPVRFLPASSDLERQAVAGSVPLPLNGGRVLVMEAEYLIAIALVTSRLQDTPWMLRLAEHDAIDEMTLKGILKVHRLMEKWADFEQKFPPRFGGPQGMRGQLAALSFAEKIKILEKLRDREKAIAAAGLRSERKNDGATKQN